MLPFRSWFATGKPPLLKNCNLRNYRNGIITSKALYFARKPLQSGFWGCDLLFLGWSRTGRARQVQHVTNIVRRHPALEALLRGGGQIGQGVTQSCLDHTSSVEGCLNNDSRCANKGLRERGDGV